MNDEAPSAPKAGPVFLAVLARRPFAALLLLCLLAWLPGFSTLPPLDRDEARFAQSSKEMLENGNFVDIRFNTETRYKKPIGIYWLQAASTALFGKPPYNQIWTYRLPSLLGAIAAVFLAYWCVRALAPPLAALVGASLLALALGVAAEAHIAKTDAVLLAAIVAAQGVLLRIYLAARGAARASPSLPLALAGWAALAIGVLVKGPVILAVVGLTALALSLWDRDWRWLAGTRPLAGAALMLALVLPWAIAIGIQTHGQFFEQALGRDFAAKLAHGEESHGAPPGYYLLLSTLTLWPVTLFALPGLGAAVERRKEPAFRFLLAWAVPCWLLFELVPTKLPHYTLPLYPALAFMAALWLIEDGEEDEPRGRRMLRYAACAQFTIGVAGIAAAIAIAPEEFGSGTPLWVVAGAAIGAAAGLLAAGLSLVRARIAALPIATVAALTFYSLLMWGVAPRLTQLWISPRAASLVAKDGVPGDPPVVTAGYGEPSLVFLLGTHIRIGTGRSAADIAAEGGGLVLVDEAQQKSFLGRLAQLHAAARAVDRLSGIDYSRGKPERITIYRVTPAPRVTTPPAE